MPHVIDPKRTRPLRIRLRIDALLREPFPKHRVGEPQFGADAAVESVIARRDVVVPPAELPGIGGEEAGGEARLVCAFQERDGQFVVVRHVQLIEARTGAVGFRDGLDGRRARGAEAVREVEFLGDGGDGELAEGVVNFVDADRGEANRGGDFVPEDGGCRVAQVGVDELAGDDAVSVEGLAVGEVCVGLAGVGGGVEPVMERFSLAL